MFSSFSNIVIGRPGDKANTLACKKRNNKRIRNKCSSVYEDVAAARVLEGSVLASLMSMVSCMGHFSSFDHQGGDTVNRN